MRQPARPHLFGVGAGRGSGGRGKRGGIVGGDRQTGAVARPLEPGDRTVADRDVRSERELEPVGQEGFARPEEGERLPKAARSQAARVETPGREVEKRQAPVCGRRREGRQEAGGSGQERVGIENRSGRDDPRDVAPHEALRNARVLDLVADCDFSSCRDESRDVGIPHIGASMSESRFRAVSAIPRSGAASRASSKNIS